MDKSPVGHLVPTTADITGGYRRLLRAHRRGIRGFLQTVEDAWNPGISGFGCRACSHPIILTGRVQGGPAGLKDLPGKSLCPVIRAPKVGGGQVGR